MKIYIASSWKNQHAVEMLTAKLRRRNHEVLSFVESNYESGFGAYKGIDFDKWMRTPYAEKAFEFNTTGAAKSDLVIYIGISGKDAAAEVGIAWGAGVPIIGLYAKGEDFGLMRKLIGKWFERYYDLLLYVEEKEFEFHTRMKEQKKIEFDFRVRNGIRETLNENGVWVPIDKKEN